MMHNVNFNSGAILLGENNHPNDGNHYIVYFEEIDGNDFIGAMISSKSYFGRNVPMESEHFQEKNEISGETWKIRYLNSHIVPTKLRKFNSMGDFEKVGQLTEDGIEFMKSVLLDKPLQTWDEYRLSQNQ